MSSKRALQIILGISLFGVVFSGSLAYRELFGQSALTCPSPGPAGTVLGYPACIYGFLMYLLLAGTASWGLLSDGAGARAKRGTRASNESTRPFTRELP